MSDLPAGWEWATLEELTDVSRPIRYGILMPKEHVEDGVPYVKVRDFSRGPLDVDSLRRTAPEIAARYERSSLLPGDVLLSIRGTYGRVTVVPESLRGGNITQDTARVAPLAGIDRRYLAAFLTSPEAQAYFRRVARGVAVKGVNIGDLKLLPVPLAPTLEQERIAAVVESYLSRLGPALAGLGGALGRLRALERSVFATAQTEGDEMALGDILVDIEAGRSFKTPGRRAAADEWGVIKVSAMTWGRFDASENKAVPGGRSVDPRHEIRSGDLLLSRANTNEYVGATVLVTDCPPRLLLSDKSMRLLPQPDIDRRWLRYALGCPQVRSQMSSLATGTSDSMRNISQAKVRALRILVPTQSRQLELADRIEAALQLSNRLRKDCESAVGRAKALRQAILRAAFSGRLVAQDSGDEPAAVLLERVRGERAAVGAAGKRRRKVRAS